MQTPETLELPVQMALAGLWLLEGVHSPRFQDDLKGQPFVEWEGMDLDVWAERPQRVCGPPHGAQGDLRFYT